MASPAAGAPPAWAARLLAWYAQQRRTLPWRDHPDPYAIWVSEVMLQQTQVETVIPYFTRFLARCPTVAALAAAPLQDVLKLWEGLGYYSRARQLHRAAHVVVADCGGALPRTAAALARLPGCGSYTAAAVASLAFGEPVPAVDGNVLRVWCRFRAITDDPRTPTVRRAATAALAPVLRRVPPADFNQALMELGALVCRPRAPTCLVCPLAPDCAACQQGRTAELPARVVRAPTPHYEVAVGVLWHAGRLLLGQRPAGGMLGGLWEFPGGKRQAGEPLTATLVRRFAAETGLAVTPGSVIGQVRHAYSHFRITVSAFACTVAAAPPPPTTLAVRWVTPAEAAALPLGRAAQRLLALALAAAR